MKVKKLYLKILLKILRNKYPQVCFKNIFKVIGELRLVKSTEEIEEIKKAIEITIDGSRASYEKIRSRNEGI